MPVRRWMFKIRRSVLDRQFREFDPPEFRRTRLLNAQHDRGPSVRNGSAVS
jgi:hypothetical protein